MNTVRQWIGYSGSNTRQRFSFSGLDPSQTYALTRYPGYITGDKTYLAWVQAGAATIISGAVHTHSKTGYYTTAEPWVIKFQPNTTGTIVLELGNNYYSGSHYSYADSYMFQTLGETQIGDSEKTGTSAMWDEFQSGSNPATHVVGSASMNTVRQWIGHSTDIPGQPQYQHFSFSNLDTSKAYFVEVHPAYVSSTSAVYVGQIVGGEGVITSGEYYDHSAHSFPSAGYYSVPAPWQFSFIPSTTSVTLQIGNHHTSGSNYMHVDHYTINDGFVYTQNSVCGYNYSDTAIDVNTRVPTNFMWEHQPWKMWKNGVNYYLNSGVDYLIAYWLGRYYGFIDDDSVNQGLRFDAPAACGNGNVEGDEQCDDDNTTNGDGCSSSCTVESGFDCVGEPSVCTAEQTGSGSCQGYCGGHNSEYNCYCDSGCLSYGDCCSDYEAVCLDPPAAPCGDGTVEGDEQCDDDNTANGDGCSSSCTVESGYDCVGEPSVCTGG